MAVIVYKITCLNKNKIRILMDASGKTAERITYVCIITGI